MVNIYPYVKETCIYIKPGEYVMLPGKVKAKSAFNKFLNIGITEDLYIKVDNKGYCQIPYINEMGKPIVIATKDNFEYYIQDTLIDIKDSNYSYNDIRAQVLHWSENNPLVKGK